eukprot:7617169-Lingulodinium_polyedra.AAC.1
MTTNKLGACRFSAEHRLRMPQTVWLYADMMQLILLMAEHCEADAVTIKAWREEAKRFLLHMERV